MDLFYETNPIPNTSLIFSLSLCFTGLGQWLLFSAKPDPAEKCSLLGYEWAPQVWHWNHWMRETRGFSFCHTAILSACHSAAWEDSSHWHKGWKQVVEQKVTTFCDDSPVEHGMYLQLLCPCLRLLSLLNIIIQTPWPCFLIHFGIHPVFSRWLEESGDICQSLSLCSPHKQLIC